MRCVRPIGQIAPMIAGGEVEVALVITGTVGRVGPPEAFGTVACAGGRARILVRPAGA